MKIVGKDLSTANARNVGTEVQSAVFDGLRNTKRCVIVTSYHQGMPSISHMAIFETDKKDKEKRSEKTICKQNCRNDPKDHNI